MTFCIQYDKTTGAICATLNTSEPPDNLPEGRGQLTFDQPFDIGAVRVNVETLIFENIPQPEPEPEEVQTVEEKIADLQQQLDELKAQQSSSE